MDGAAMLAELRARFGSDVVETHEHRGDHTAVVTREALRRVLAWCRDEPSLAFEMLTDLTAGEYVKYAGRQDGPRVEVGYHLYSLTHNHRLRLKVRRDEDDAPVPTSVALRPSADCLERGVLA